MNQNNIRNFVIIAHIDHGKSTLADRLLEVTGTVEARRMKPQYLDQLELERERGITIKMAPVRMAYRQSEFVLNLIDTPGHSDFSYEVSRALEAVEGAILLVDATKGIQAQTLSNFRMAKNAGLAIIGAVNKIDLPQARASADKIIQSLAELLGVSPKEIFRISGKTGEGVEELLEAVIRRVPPPAGAGKSGGAVPRALIFDSLYDDHKGIIAFVRVFDGEFETGGAIKLLAADAGCKIKETGYFSPELKPSQKLSVGEIGYIATGVKEPAKVKIGDTIIARNYAENTQTNGDNFQRESALSRRKSANLALPGYKEPTPVVFVSFYPDGKTKFEDMKRAFERLRLTDSALRFEPDSSEALGKGLKVGFLGQLHFEITSSRLEREFGLQFLTTFPSIAYRVKERGETRIVKDANEFPADPDEVWQPMIAVELFAPPEYLNQIMSLQKTFYMEVREIKNIGANVMVAAMMPLAELMRDFDDSVKSASAGYASFSYELQGEARADVEKLEVMVNGEAISALTRIVFKEEAEREARVSVERLKNLLPAQQFSQALQARVRGRIVARESIPATRKDVTGYLYGGDRTRKMKLWKKQKAGKEKLQERARVSITPETFRELLKK